MPNEKNLYNRGPGHWQGAILSIQYILSIGKIMASGPFEVKRKKKKIKRNHSVLKNTSYLELPEKVCIKRKGGTFSYSEPFSIIQLSTSFFFCTLLPTTP